MFLETGTFINTNSEWFFFIPQSFMNKINKKNLFPSQLTLLGLVSLLGQHQCYHSHSLLVSYIIMLMFFGKFYCNSCSFQFLLPDTKILIKPIYLFIYLLYTLKERHYQHHTTLNINPWVMCTIQEGQFLHQTTLNTNTWVVYTHQEGQYVHQTTLNTNIWVVYTHQEGQYVHQTTLNTNTWVVYTHQEGQYVHQTTLNTNTWVVYTHQEGQYVHQTTLNTNIWVVYTLQEGHYHHQTTLNSNLWVMYTLQEGQFHHQTTPQQQPNGWCTLFKKDITTIRPPSTPPLWVMYTLQEGQYLHQTTLNSMLAIHQMLYVNSLRHTEKVAVVRAGLTRGKLLLLSQEFHRMILKFQRSNQSMKSSCCGIGRVRQCPSGNTSSWLCVCMIQGSTLTLVWKRGSDLTFVHSVYAWVQRKRLQNWGVRT